MANDLYGPFHSHERLALVLGVAMIDADALALCAFQEANLEPADGLAAIPRVILNRMAAHYESDGTIQGTVFKHAQFSWTEYGFSNGRYSRVAWTPPEVAMRAETLLIEAKSYRVAWARAVDICAQVTAKTYTGLDYDRLTDEVVLYDNLAVTQPPWATPDKLVCQIGHHSFFRA